MVKKLLSRRNLRKKIEILSSKRPGYNLVRHPRYFDKPLACKSGVHKALKTIVIGNIPCMYCSKCGEFMYEGILKRTWSKKDINKASNLAHKQTKSRTKEEIIEQLWEKHQLTRSQKRRRMQESIREHVRKRLELVQ